MHLWDYDRKTIKKGILGKRFILERLINFGLNGRKLNKKEVKKHFKYLRLDPKKRDFLKLILWR